MNPGEWYQTHTEIARMVSRLLGFQGRAVYDELSSRADNRSGETFVSPAAIAEEFDVTERHIRRILTSLVKIGAVEFLTRGNQKLYRVNRECPDILRTLGHICPETPEMSGHLCQKVLSKPSAYKEELDSKQNTPQRATISDFDCELDFAAAELMRGLRMFGTDARPLCRSSVKAFCEEFQLPPLRGPDEITALYARYTELGGSKEAVFFLKNGTFLKPESQWGIHGVNQSSRHQAKAEQRAASWDRAFGVRRELDS